MSRRGSAKSAAGASVYAPSLQESVTSGGLPEARALLHSLRTFSAPAAGAVPRAPKSGDGLSSDGRSHSSLTKLAVSLLRARDEGSRRAGSVLATRIVVGGSVPGVDVLKVLTPLLRKKVTVGRRAVLAGLTEVLNQFLRGRTARVITRLDREALQNVCASLLSLVELQTKSPAWRMRREVAAGGEGGASNYDDDDDDDDDDESSSMSKLSYSPSPERDAELVLCLDCLCVVSVAMPAALVHAARRTCAPLAALSSHPTRAVRKRALALAVSMCGVHGDPAYWRALVDVCCHELAGLASCLSRDTPALVIAAEAAAAVMKGGGSHSAQRKAAARARESARKATAANYGDKRKEKGAKGSASNAKAKAKSGSSRAWSPAAAAVDALSGLRGVTGISNAAAAAAAACGRSSVSARAIEMAATPLAEDLCDVLCWCLSPPAALPGLPLFSLSSLAQADAGNVLVVAETLVAAAAAAPSTAPAHSANGKPLATAAGLWLAPLGLRAVASLASTVGSVLLRHASRCHALLRRALELGARASRDGIAGVNLDGNGNGNGNGVGGSGCHGVLAAALRATCDTLSAVGPAFAKPSDPRFVRAAWGAAVEALERTSARDKAAIAAAAAAGGGSEASASSLGGGSSKKRKRNGGGGGSGGGRSVADLFEDAGRDDKLRGRAVAPPSTATDLSLLRCACEAAGLLRLVLQRGPSPATTLLPTDRHRCDRATLAMLSLASSPSSAAWNYAPLRVALIELASASAMAPFRGGAVSPVAAMLSNLLPLLLRREGNSDVTAAASTALAQLRCIAQPRGPALLVPRYEDMAAEGLVAATEDAAAAAAAAAAAEAEALHKKRGEAETSVEVSRSVDADVKEAIASAVRSAKAAVAAEFAAKERALRQQMEGLKAQLVKAEAKIATAVHTSVSADAIEEDDVVMEDRAKGVEATQEQQEQEQQRGQQQQQQQQDFVAQESAGDGEAEAEAHEGTHREQLALEEDEDDEDDEFPDIV